MGEFYRDLFNKGVKGKKVSRNYQRHMQEFADRHFSREFAELPDEQLKVDLYQTLTQLTQSHRLQHSSNASKQLLTELSFHSKDQDSSCHSASNPHLMQEVSYEEESSVSELITELKKPSTA